MCALHCVLGLAAPTPEFTQGICFGPYVIYYMLLMLKTATVRPRPVVVFAHELQLSRAEAV